MALIDHMVKGMYEPVPDPEVEDLLTHFEIWVVPFVSPGGRIYDDDDFGDFGDPMAGRYWRKNRQWFQVFDCASDWSTRPFSGNCNGATLEDDYGINVARNFSVGWDNYAPDEAGELCLDPASNPVPCANDAYCVDVSNGLVAGVSFDSGLCQLNPRMFCNDTGVCAYSATDTCCDRNFKGLRPFESLEARMIRHIVLNIPIVTVLDAHSFNGSLGRVRKSGPNADDDPYDASYLETTADETGPISSADQDLGLDESNMNYVHRGAVEAYNEAAADEWSVATGEPAADMPDFLRIASQIWGTGTGAGQLAGWAAGQAVEDDAAPAFFSSGIEGNFDNDTFRGINAYEVELPPRAGVDPDTLPTNPLPPYVTYQGYLDFASDNDCGPVWTGTTTSVDRCFYPDSQLSVRATTAGFIALAEYVIRDTAHPNVGRDRDGGHFDDALSMAFPGGSPYTYFDRRSGTFPDSGYGYLDPTYDREDTAVVGLQIHDGEGRGVLQAEFDMEEIEYEYTAKVFLPAGNWPVSSDVVYENYRDASTGALPWETNYQLTISLSPLGTSTSSECEPQSHVFDSDSLHGPLPPGDAGDRRYTRRFEFLPGCDYLVTSELTMVNDNDTFVNDIRTLKVSTTGCADGPRPSHLDEDEYCNRRIHEDASYDPAEFACVGFPATCRQCYLDDGVFESCDGNGFCVNGMCDEPYECWSGEIEDAFESGISILGASDMHFSGEHDFGFSGTLHQDSGARDEDVVSWSVSGGTLPEVWHSYNRIELLVTDECDTPLAGAPYEDVETRVSLVPGAFPYSALPAAELLPWSVPTSTVPFVIVLDAAQQEDVRNGARIQIQLRNVADSLSPGVFPSLSYAAMVSIGSGLLDLLLSGATVMPIPEHGSVLVSDAASSRSDAGEVHRLSVSEEKAAAGELVYFRPRAAYADPGDAPQMIVADQEHETVAVARADQHGGLAASLAGLDAQAGPFDVVIGAGRVALDGELYYCPAAAAADCFDLEVDRLCGGGMCAGAELCCEADPNVGPECVDPEGDPENCGGCGAECAADEICLSGVCAVVDSLDCAGTTCPEGMSCCEDDTGIPECVSLRSDSGRCGSCGYACPSFARCVEGVCLPRTGEPCAKTCTGGKTCCYVLGWQKCANVLTDRNNCGGCGVICDWNEECDEGECVPWLSVHDPCLFGMVNCGGDHAVDCASTENDESNCGDCGVRCAFGSTCEQGVCRRPWSADENVADER